ncbi:MAG: TIGR00282 family metallophosphoesterase [Clostridiales bacterium]|nr:TIGR00282 family metallophosphoesterase [Candidatus Equinaster intestinalis]
MVKVLCIGDVCGSVGRNALRNRVNGLKHQYGIDFTVINGENSADGNGITPASALDLFSIGADVIAGGNHSFRRSEVFDFYEQNPFVLRPQNIHTAEFGSGYCLFDMGKFSIAVLNISGCVYLDRLNPDNPFICADQLIERAKNDGANIILVDFHAEATSEKRALGFYLDGKVSALFGTHTHVLTADCQILPSGTGYITDIGMTGPKQSVLGVKSEIIIERLKNGDQHKFELAKGPSIINGCIFEIDEKSGKAVNAFAVCTE